LDCKFCCFFLGHAVAVGEINIKRDKYRNKINGKSIDTNKECIYKFISALSSVCCVISLSLSAYAVIVAFDFDLGALGKCNGNWSRRGIIFYNVPKASTQIKTQKKVKQRA